MIGMMNNAGMDGPVEFYAGRRDLCILLAPASTTTPGNDGQSQQPAAAHHQATTTQIFEPTPQKKLSYTDSGRRLVDGKPERSDTPEEMWRKAMLRATCTRAVKEMLGEKRRKSSKLRQLIANQSGSIRHFFGTAKNYSRQRTTTTTTNQQQLHVETSGNSRTPPPAAAAAADGPGKPDRMAI